MTSTPTDPVSGREELIARPTMKMFPILFGHRVKEEIEAVRRDFGTSIVIALPWPMLAAHERQADKNHSQTIQRLADRGGLSACEACAVLEDRSYREMTPFAAHARLKELFMEYVAAEHTAALRARSP